MSDIHRFLQGGGDIDISNEQLKEAKLITEAVLMKPIGYMRSPFKFKNGTPRQATVCSHARGSLTIEKSVFNNPEHSLDGLEGFSHLWLLFVFHKNNNEYTKAKVRPPRLNGRRVGLFSTRSPYRPNNIGLTLAKIDRVEGPTVYVSSIDILDGTPVLDIKPYIPQYDNPVNWSPQSLPQDQQTKQENIEAENGNDFFQCPLDGVDDSVTATTTVGNCLNEAKDGDGKPEQLLNMTNDDYEHKPLLGNLEHVSMTTKAEETNPCQQARNKLYLDNHDTSTNRKLEKFYVDDTEVVKEDETLLTTRISGSDNISKGKSNNGASLTLNKDDITTAILFCSS